MIDIIYMLVNSICIIVLCIILINTIKRQIKLSEEIETIKSSIK